MDRDLLRQCLTYHGESLFNKLKCEQTENPDFQAVVSDLCKATCERSDGQDSVLVEQFIARKADCFVRHGKLQLIKRKNMRRRMPQPYAIMPPVELFMEVSYEERRAMLYRDLERGDIVVGRINNIRDYGFLLTLLCTAGGLKRDIEDLELSALCHVREIPSSGSHDDPLSYYQIGDFIRAAVKDIDRYQEKITVSLHPASLSSSLEHIKLGVFPREELPIHYSRSVRAAADSSETYECILKICHGYHNPSVVDFLLEKSLLCGPSLSVGSVVPLMERLSEETLWGFSLHLLCATRRGQYDSSIEKLLDRCPQAIIAYANHQLQDKHMALWWQKLLPELCNRTRAATDNSILLAALKETLVVVAMETSPTEFLELIPDDGTASG